VSLYQFLKQYGRRSGAWCILKASHPWFDDHCRLHRHRTSTFHGPSPLSLYSSKENSVRQGSETNVCTYTTRNKATIFCSIRRSVLFAQPSYILPANFSTKDFMQYEKAKCAVMRATLTTYSPTTHAFCMLKVCSLQHYSCMRMRKISTCACPFFPILYLHHSRF
jgi:hypothetical protein